MNKLDPGPWGRLDPPTRFTFSNFCTQVCAAANFSLKFITPLSFDVKPLGMVLETFNENFDI